METETKTLPEILISAGYPPRVARMFAWLVNSGGRTITSREIEKGADMRQPEVAQTLKVFQGWGWIEQVNGEQKAQVRGRPIILYRFTLTREQSAQTIHEFVKKKADALVEIGNSARQEIFAVQGVN